MVKFMDQIRGALGLKVTNLENPLTKGDPEELARIARSLQEASPRWGSPEHHDLLEGAVKAQEHFESRLEAGADLRVAAHELQASVEVAYEEMDGLSTSETSDDRSREAIPQDPQAPHQGEEALGEGQGRRRSSEGPVRS